MDLLPLLKIFVLLFGVYLILDYLWLGILMKDFYRSEMGKVTKGILNRSILIGIFVYILVPVGILLFVLNNPLSSTFPGAFLLGVLFGLIVYGVYDLTNYVVFDKWSLRLAFVDVFWGMFVCGILGFLARYLDSVFR